ncbi:hypothetical protein [Fodinicola feengrottensis]|uniref:hypothetical protein n=1 Tax=Fodinicola feengrottensis TaxID=435914 RepID=UPI0013D4419B|nr:hypothetical protein [Fodinicola feengrottensis]
MPYWLVIADGFSAGVAAAGFFAVGWPWDLLIIPALAGWVALFPYGRRIRPVTIFGLTVIFVTLWVALLLSTA